MTNYVAMNREELESYISHYGKKGMKWGVRKQTPTNTDRKTDKIARKDAEEFARAKSFYGEGAGTRRKLIKQTVEARSKKSHDYKKAFEHHLDKQDQSKHATKAISERRRKDTTAKTKKSAGFLARKFTGEQGTQAAFTAVALAGAAYLSTPQGRRQMQTAATKISKSKAAKQGAELLKRAIFKTSELITY